MSGGDFGLDIPCGLCFKRIDGDQEAIYLLRDRRMVHLRCILKYGLDPYAWIHASGSWRAILTHLFDHPFGPKPGGKRRHCKRMRDARRLSIGA
jgi:hypothetical protein